MFVLISSLSKNILYSNYVFQRNNKISTCHGSFCYILFQPGGEGDLIGKYWDGSVRSWFSLELVSIDGSVRFFIWTKEKFKDMIETQLYSQFPDIEIADISDKDYARAVPFDPDNYQYWGCEFVKSGPSHVPIKTYTAYKLHEDPKEFKIDPYYTCN